MGQGYLALTTVEWLLDATLRVLREWQGIVLGNVLVGFVVHYDIDVLLFCGPVLLVGTINGNGTLGRPLLTLRGDGIAGAGAEIPHRCRICGPAGCTSLRFHLGCRPATAKQAATSHASPELATAETATTSHASPEPAAAEPAATSPASPALAREAFSVITASASPCFPTEPCFMNLATGTFKSLAAAICCSLNSANTPSNCSGCCVPSQELLALFRHLVLHLPQ